jgi:arylsulfatase A-like enzyme
MFAYQPGYVEDYGAAHGISYGSLYNYDTQTPLVFYGPQFAAQQVERTVELTDVAATLARACAFSLPSSATGRVLHEAFPPGTPSPPQSQEIK